MSAPIDPETIPLPSPEALARLPRRLVADTVLATDRSTGDHGWGILLRNAYRCSRNPVWVSVEGRVPLLSTKEEALAAGRRIVERIAAERDASC